MKKAVFLGLGLLWISACAGHDERLLDKAEAELLVQRSQLAKHLFSQVIENRKRPDALRRRALEGLAEVSKTQLFDYRTAVRTYEQLISEYPGDGASVRRWRFEAGRIWMKNLQDPERAWKVLEPMSKEQSLSVEEAQKIARVLLNLRDFEQSLAFMEQAWVKAMNTKTCSQLRSLQLDYVQNFFIQKKCDRVLEWAERPLVAGCEPDRFSLSLEKAHCLEISGEVQKARTLLSQMIERHPSNQRAHFLLKGLEIRARQKERR